MAVDVNLLAARLSPGDRELLKHAAKNILAVRFFENLIDMNRAEVLEGYSDDDVMEMAQKISKVKQTNLIHLGTIEMLRAIEGIET